MSVKRKSPCAYLFKIRAFNVSYYESNPDDAEIEGSFAQKFDHVSDGVRKMLDSGARMYENENGGTDYTGPPSSYYSCQKKIPSKKKPGDVFVTYKSFEIEDALPLFDKKIYDKFQQEVKEYIEEDKAEKPGWSCK